MSSRVKDDEDERPRRRWTTSRPRIHGPKSLEKWNVYSMKEILL